MILATDGDFNVGLSDPDALEGLHRHEARQRHLSLGAGLRARHWTTP
ncbi:MAG: hypothetical protein R3D85_05700 [Paracoccaceae bacterium]